MLLEILTDMLFIHEASQHDIDKVNPRIKTKVLCLHEADMMKHQSALVQPVDLSSLCMLVTRAPFY